MSKALLRSLLVAGSALSGTACVAPAPSLAASSADHALADTPFPSLPSPGQVDEAAHTLGSPLNNPVTGSAISPLVIGGDRPPSLEALQAARPGSIPARG